MPTPNRVRKAKRELVDAARDLRVRQTRAEEVLWKELRGNRLIQARVRRQHPVGGFVLDFWIPAARLAIELDGSIHDDPEYRAQDAARTEIVEAYNIRLIRFQNADVLNDLDSVLKQIKIVVEERMAKSNL